MRANLTVLLVLILAAGLAGCGPSPEERRAREQKRFEQEEQAQRDLKRANEAITEMNKKLGRKPPTMDLNLPPGSPPQPAPEEPKQP